MTGTMKEQTNRRWTSNESYRDNYDQIFGRRNQAPAAEVSPSPQTSADAHAQEAIPTEGDGMGAAKPKVCCGCGGCARKGSATLTPKGSASPA